MFFEDSDYIRFLRNPRVYFDGEISHQKNEWEPRMHKYYPVGEIGNVSLHFNHYKTFEDAVKKWNERKQRINWYNLFAVMHTENKEILEQFEELPYGKKACFVPFKSDLDSAFYISPKFHKGRTFREVTFDISRGLLFYYDVFDMLLYGKKTQLIDM